ncbi:HPP family protein [Natronoarchaeum philippinense]|uniref:HPP family protein n=1 Tax=Natronoarchaeum philippinense TaxID=558529 RepID=A0A285P1T1_NATPI|nr:HPP family protein [Natronoarchaeum philippinense]SNZ15692.1 HPP family protein [Natronoarchaeum philippinense]
MRNRLLNRFRGGVRWLRRRLGRAIRGGRLRLEETTTLVHVSILLFVPVVVGLLTYLSTQLDYLSFFLFPPLAAGTYALFANPEHEAASPVRFVAGLTAGAVCAWIAVGVAVVVIYPDQPAAAIEVDAPGAAFAVFLTGVVTWALDIEEAAAFSTALLGLLVDPVRQASFVASVFVSSTLVATVFAVWRQRFYKQRARYLYASTTGADNVLVPIRGDPVEATTMIAGRIAAAHDAGKVVLLDVVEEDSVATAERALLGNGADTETAVDADADAGGGGAAPALEATVADLEQLADRVETVLDVPCEVIVAPSGGSPATTVRRVADEANCDLIAAPYETEDGEVTPYVERLLAARMDVLVHRSCDGRTDWRRITVPVRRAGDTAHAMIDFACRLAGDIGRVSVAHCIDAEAQRRTADEMLANLAETPDCDIETRVPKASIERFLRQVAPATDLVVVGASRDRSTASRLVSPPTFERIDDLDTDLAIVAHR